MLFTSSVFAWSSIWTTLQPTPTIKSLEKLLILSIFISPLCKNWHSSYLWWWAVSASLVCPHYIRVLKPCQAFFETFLNFFSLSLIFFYWFGRSVLFRAFLCFVSLVGTRTVYTSSQSKSSIFLKKVEKSFQKNSRPLIVNKKEQDLFFLPFHRLWDYMYI
jgi:hypothetical protein